MASLTVRQLDERLKKLLRLRAARSGRSVEDEVRTILRAAAEETGTEVLESSSPPCKTSPRRAVSAPATKRVLLIIGGGIAAYKSLDLIRRLKERGIAVRCILTKAAEHFVTPLSAGAIVGERVFTDLFDAGERIRRRPHPPRARHRSRRRRAGHRRPDGENGRRSRRRSRHRGAAGDGRENSAGAGDEPAYVGEQGDAAQSRAARRRRRACWSARTKARWRRTGERGLGRMAEPLEIAAAVEKLLAAQARSRLRASACWSRPARRTSRSIRCAISPTARPASRVTPSPRRRPRAGAAVTLVSGPVNLPDPPGVTVLHVETARDMLRAVENALPADVAIFAAAVADWRVANAGEQKIKKKAGAADARIVAGGKSRHSLDHRAPQIAAAETGDRLCRRNRKRRRQCQGKACAQRLRLDPRQRRLAGRPASWAATATPSSW